MMITLSVGACARKARQRRKASCSFRFEPTNARSGLATASNDSASAQPAALIVGAGRGLGRAIALELARRGYRVVAARTPSEIEAVASEITAQGGAALAIQADATQTADIERLVQRTLDTFGQIDVLVNCAGEPLIKPTAQTSDADWQRIIASNLTAVFLTCRAVMPHMMARRQGHIVNISSKVGRDGAPNVAAYTAAKAGVIGLSKALAAELKPYTVRVSVIAPSPMDTPMRWAATPNFDRTKTIPPERIAQLVAFVIADPTTNIEEIYPISSLL